MSLLRRLDQSWKCKCGRHSRPPVRIRIGSGAIHEIPDILKRLNAGEKVTIVEDVNTRAVAGAELSKDLKTNGFIVTEVIVGKPDESNAALIEQKVENQTFLLGVGGTSVLDLTKLVAQRRSIRYALFSTGLANSGIVSRTASIYVRGRKESIPTNLADAVIVDLDIVGRAPNWMSAAGVGDLVIETIAVKDWQLGRDETGEAYCESIAELEMSALDQVQDNAEAIRSHTPSGIVSLADSLVVAGLGMAMWGSSRPSSGSEHLWSHWLEHYAEENGLPLGRHGEQVGVGTLLMAKYHEFYNPNWWSQEEYTRYQAEALKQSLRQVGCPTTLESIEVSRELAVKAFVGSWEYRKDRYTILHKRHPNNDDAEKMIAESGV